MGDKRFLTELPPDTMVPMSLAPTVIGRSRSTVYGWIAAGLLVAEDSPDGMLVRVGALQDAESNRKRGRPRKSTKMQDKAGL